LHQVEYAIEAINNAGTCLALQSVDGVVLAAERRVVSVLLAPSKTSEKTYTIDDHCVCLVAGLTSDANILINQARTRSQRFLYTYQEQMPVEQIVKSVCNYKQAYTQYGGLRPFGTAFLFAGWDKNFGFQLYQTDPSGNYSGWKATVIGQNNQAGKSILKTDYSENNTINQNLKIAAKILIKTMDSTTPSSERIELSVLRKEDDGSLVHHTLSSSEIQVLLDEIQKEIETEQKKAEATTGDL
jgi:20S proteasome subunit alpha 3